MGMGKHRFIWLGEKVGSDSREDLGYLLTFFALKTLRLKIGSVDSLYFYCS